MDLRLFSEAMKTAWCADTAFSADRPAWTPQKPSVGQCTVTAMIVSDYFHAKIIRGVSKKYNIVHYWNEIDGKKVDLTEDQFIPDKADITFESIRTVKKDSLLKIRSVRKRYNLLKDRLQASLDKIG